MNKQAYMTGYLAKEAGPYKWLEERAGAAAESGAKFGQGVKNFLWGSRVQGDPARLRAARQSQADADVRAARRRGERAGGLGYKLSTLGRGIADAPGHIEDASKSVQSAAAEAQQGIQDVKAGFQKYKTPLLLAGLAPLFMGGLNTMARFGQKSQLANIAQALQQRGALGTRGASLMAKNPYMQRALRRTF